ncbi:hypothetical protein THAOC_22580 [Thalassiosira oceanica]|uniref:Uncharacterized protein n=1 Tax=Thalassiosira oceanica TaxID=159749 RepID=K0RY20_THAOC|nr:hypothetical protein THAOC_22580 [Thalassiosira oceanica]|eukprot:EJK57379.1 hypothetical protein THAOC_22580 [Thalassiosira oceanica]
MTLTNTHRAGAMPGREGRLTDEGRPRILFLSNPNRFLREGTPVQKGWMGECRERRPEGDGSPGHGGEMAERESRRWVTLGQSLLRREEHMINTINNPIPT